MRLFFAPTLNHPVVFYRMEQFVVRLRELGHEVAFRYRGPADNQTCLWEHNVMEAKDPMSALMGTADVSVFQKIHTRWGLALLYALKEKWPTKPMLMELDDDPYSIQPGHDVSSAPGGSSEIWTDEQVKMCDAVIVSTEHLKERILARYDKRVHVVPNAINFEVYDKLKVRVASSAYAGWAGGGSHGPDLRLLKDVPSALSDVQFGFYSGAPAMTFLEGPNVKQVHMTERPFGVAHMDGKMWWKSMIEYPRWMASRGFRIGLAPLLDTQFNRAKSNLRWLEYSALGVPTVASPVRPFKETIRHGETGFLAANTREWVEAIGAMSKDEGLRKSVGDAAREQALEQFSVDVVTRHYEEVLKSYG